MSLTLLKIWNSRPKNLRKFDFQFFHSKINFLQKYDFFIHRFFFTGPFLHNVFIICIIPHRKDETTHILWFRPAFPSIRSDQFQFHLQIINQRMKVRTFFFRRFVQCARIHLFFILHFRFLTKLSIFTYRQANMYVWPLTRTSSQNERRLRPWRDTCSVWTRTRRGSSFSTQSESVMKKWRTCYSSAQQLESYSSASDVEDVPDENNNEHDTIRLCKDFLGNDLSSDMEPNNYNRYIFNIFIPSVDIF